MLADNRLALNASWDQEMLQLELQALAESGFNLDLTGFDQQELDQLLASLSRQVLVDPDEAPDLCTEVVTQPGDLWILGDHRLLCGDGTKGECQHRYKTTAFSPVL
jgi:hypothetical protein